MSCHALWDVVHSPETDSNIHWAKNNVCTWVAMLCGMWFIHLKQTVTSTVCFRWMNHIPQSMATHVHTLFFAQWMLLSVSGEWTTSHKAWQLMYIHCSLLSGCYCLFQVNEPHPTKHGNSCTYIVLCSVDVTVCFRWMNHVPQSVATHVHTLFFAQWMLLSVSGEWTTSHKAWQLMYIHCSLLSGCYCLFQVNEPHPTKHGNSCTYIVLCSVDVTVCFRWMNHIPQSVATHVHTLFFAQWMLLSVSGEWTTSHKAWQLMYIHCSLLSGCYCLFQVNEPHPTKHGNSCTYIVLCSVDATVCFRWMNHIPQSVATHVHTLFFAQWMLLSVSGEWTTSHKAWQLMYIHCSLLSGCYCLFQVNEPHPTKHGNSCTYIVLCSVDVTVCFRWMNHIPQSMATRVHTLFFAQWMLLSVSGEWTTSHKAWQLMYIHCSLLSGCYCLFQVNEPHPTKHGNSCTYIVLCSVDATVCFRWMNHIPQSMATHVHTLFFAQWMLLSVSGEWTTSHKAWQLMYIHCSLLSGCYCLFQVNEPHPTKHGNSCTYIVLCSVDVTVCFRWMNHIPQSMATHVHTLFFAQWMLLSVSGEWTTSHKAWQLMYIHCSLLSGCYCLFQVNEPHPTKRGNSCTYIVLCSVDVTVCFRWMNHIPQSMATHVHTLFFAQWMLLSVSGEWTTSHKAWQLMYIHCSLLSGCYWAKNNVCTWVARLCGMWFIHLKQTVTSTEQRTMYVHELPCFVGCGSFTWNRQ